MRLQKGQKFTTRGVFKQYHLSWIVSSGSKVLGRDGTMMYEPDRILRNQHKLSVGVELRHQPGQHGLILAINKPLLFSDSIYKTVNFQ